MRTVVLSIVALLQSAVPDDPQDHEVATQYKNNFEEFKTTAKMWTENYAVEGGNTALASKVKQLVDMG